jgi:cysteine-rich repeat protein
MGIACLALTAISPLLQGRPVTGFVSWCMFGNCGPVCGNLVVEEGETCDDGNTIDGDGCENSCQESTTDSPIEPSFNGWADDLSTHVDPASLIEGDTAEVKSENILNALFYLELAQSTASEATIEWNARQQIDAVPATNLQGEEALAAMRAALQESDDLKKSLLRTYKILNPGVRVPDVPLEPSSKGQTLEDVRFLTGQMHAPSADVNVIGVMAESAVYLALHEALGNVQSRAPAFPRSSAASSAARSSAPSRVSYVADCGVDPGKGEHLSYSHYYCSTAKELVVNHMNRCMQRERERCEARGGIFTQFDRTYDIDVTSGGIFGQCVVSVRSSYRGLCMGATNRPLPPPAPPSLPNDAGCARRDTLSCNDGGGCNNGKTCQSIPGPIGGVVRCECR